MPKPLNARASNLCGRFFIFVAALSFIYNGAAAQPLPIEKEREIVQNVAKAALPGLARAAGADKRSYGFEAGDDVTRAELGEPYRVFNLKTDALKTYKPSEAITNLLTPAQEWIFPVQHQGSNRVVLIVRETERGWKAIYFGNGFLARQLQRMQNQWAAKKDARITLVSLTDIRSFWYSVQPQPVENLSPLNDVPLPGGLVIAAPLKPLETIPASESVPKLARALFQLEPHSDPKLLK